MGDRMESTLTPMEVKVFWQMRDHRDIAMRYPKRMFRAKDRDLPDSPWNPVNLQEKGKYWPVSRRRPALQAGGERILSTRIV